MSERCPQKNVEKRVDFFDINKNGNILSAFDYGNKKVSKTKKKKNA